MDNKTYVILLATGSYDDYNVQTLFVTNDYEKGLAYVNKQNMIYNSLKNKTDSFYRNEYLQWQYMNPKPSLRNYREQKVPKWSSNVKVTKEMRIEREAIEKSNREMANKANLPIFSWAKTHKDFIDNWFKEHLTSQEYAMHVTYHSDSEYSIEEIAWL